MKKSGKMIAAVLTAGLTAVTLLAGCGGGGTTDSTSAAAGTSSVDSTAADSTSTGGTDGSESSAASGETALKDVTMILGMRDEFRGSLEAGTIKAAEEQGINLNTVDAQNDTSKMLQFIETAKNNGEKAIIINMVDPETAAQCVEAAGDMKVVFVNYYPGDPSVLNESVVYVGSNETDSGKYQGEYLAKYFNDKGKTSIKYILLSGTLGNTATTMRTESVLQALKDNGIEAEEATAPLVCDYERATAIDMISPVLTGGTEFDCIIANNDAMALGAIEALKAADMDPAATPVVGIDATLDGIQALKDGSLAMTVFQDANGQGYGALMAAANLVDGKPLNDGTSYDVDETGFVLWVPFEPVTKDNVAEYENKNQ